MRALHRTLLAATLAAAALAAWVGDSGDSPAARRGEVSAVTVGQWLRDRAVGLRIVDLRPPADFARGHLPAAVRIAPGALVPTDLLPARRVVLYGEDAEAARAAAALRAAGVEALVLRGGYAAWVREVLEPQIPAGAAEREPYRSAAALARYFGGRPRVGGAPARSWRGC